MAQRGGVVESTILIGCASPKLSPGEADILIGFEALETLRGLPYLKPGGFIFSSSEFQWPLSVSMAQATCPSLETIEAAASQCTDKARFFPSQAMGLEAGALQAGNIALLGAVAASGALPFDENALRSTLEKRLNPKIAGVNLKALDLGVAAARA
jgi:indolepyruvate ferredoxin oxidoreductase beta subunit